jgi:hypothetical protein
MPAPDAHKSSSVRSWLVRLPDFWRQKTLAGRKIIASGGWRKMRVFDIRVPFNWPSLLIKRDAVHLVSRLGLDSEPRNAVGCSCGPEPYARGLWASSTQRTLFHDHSNGGTRQRRRRAVAWEFRRPPAKRAHLAAIGRICTRKARPEKVSIEVRPSLGRLTLPQLDRHYLCQVIPITARLRGGERVYCPRSSA